jgi:hypothetical protein
MTRDPKPMRLVSFKPLVKDALRGLANVQLPNGLLINDCPICISKRKAWASLPGKLVLGRDGRKVEAKQCAGNARLARPRDRRWVVGGGGRSG